MRHMAQAAQIYKTRENRKFGNSCRFVASGLVLALLRVSVPL